METGFIISKKILGVNMHYFFYYIEIFLYDIICQTHQVLHEYYQI